MNSFLRSLLIGSLIVIASFFLHQDQHGSIEQFVNEKEVTIRGIVIEEPDVRPMQTKYTIEARTIFLENESINVNGRVLVSFYDGWPEYLYGDEVEISGKLTKPGMIEDFNYANYLSIDEIYVLMDRASMKKISSNNGNIFFAWLYIQKARFELQIARVFPEPHASLLMGLLTGSRRGMPEHLTEDFKRTGLTHIVAISGYNITIIIFLFSYCLFFLPLKWRFVPLTIGITIFTLFVGASASVVRAAIMGILGLIAIQLERPANMRLFILWAAVFMLAWNPKYLLYDAGFQLSFLALIGITELTPLIERKMTFVPKDLGIRTALSATLGAQIATLPLVYVLFQRISLVAPITNLLVAPLLPFAMLFGFLGTVLSFFLFPLGQIIGFIGYIFLHLIILIAKGFSWLPFAAIL